MSGPDAAGYSTIALLAGALLTLQEHGQGPEFLVRQVLVWERDGPGRVMLGILEVADQPLNGTSSRAFNAEIRSDLPALAVQLVASVAPFLPVQSPSVTNKIGLGSLHFRTRGAGLLPGAWPAANCG
jgi:hypothetical protein